MSWFRPLVVLLALGACGFEPVNAPGSGFSSLQGRILVDAPETREGFVLVQRLEERLGRGGIQDFTLEHAINIRQQGLAVDPEGDVRRFNLLGRVDWALRRKETGDILASGVVENFTGYSATGTTVATLTAEQDARQRLMTILADQIVQRLQAARIDA